MLSGFVLGAELARFERKANNEAIPRTRYTANIESVDFKNKIHEIIVIIEKGYRNFFIKINYNLLFAQFHREATARSHIDLNLITAAEYFFFNHIASLMITIMRIFGITIDSRNIVNIGLQEV